MKITVYSALLFLVISAFSPALDTIKIAAVFSITGEAASTGDEHLVTARYAVKEINNNGGVLGRQIELIEFDNESTSLGSRQAAKTAVKKEISAAFGGSWSSYVLAMAPVFQEVGVPLLTPVATNPEVTKTGKYIFRVCFIDQFQGNALARFAYNDLKARKIAVLTNSDQIFSISLSDEFIRSFTSSGGEITAELKYIENMSDYGDLIDKLVQSRFDAVFLPGYVRDSAQIIKTARNKGVTSVFLGGDGWSHLMYNYAPVSIENSYYITHWHKSMKDKKSRDFLEKMETIFPYDKINAGMALSYDMVYLLADAIERAGTDDREMIQKALASTESFTGVTGKISFNKNRDPVKPAVIVKFENRSSVFIKQIE